MAGGDGRSGTASTLCESSGGGVHLRGNSYRAAIIPVWDEHGTMELFQKQATRKLLALYSRCLAMRTANRLKLGRHIGASIAVFAKQKAVYNWVLAAES